MARHYYSTVAVSTTLTSGISNSATSMAVGSTTGFPGSFPYYLALDSEVVEVTNAVGLTLTIVRGVSGTSAAAHNAGVAVTHVAPSDFYNEASIVSAIDSGTGIVTQTASGTFTKRSIVSSGDAIVVTNGNGVAGNPSLAVQAKLEAIADSSATGFWTHVGGSAVANRTITAGSSKIAVTNGDGVSGNPTVDVVPANFPAPTVQRFTSSGTWNKPAGLVGVFVDIQAGGGGSGGVAATSAQSAIAGGGQGGSFLRIWVPASALGATETVTVGAAGAAGASGTNSGGDGGTSSFGAHGSAPGGAGGSGGAANTVVGQNGGGNASQSPTVGGSALQLAFRAGGDGGNGTRHAANWAIPGEGGESQFAGRTRPSAVTTTSNNAGIVGGNYGGGSAGCACIGTNSARAGAAGGPGIVIVTEVYS